MKDSAARTSPAPRALVAPRPPALLEKLFQFVTGAWLGLTLVKLGNPVIFEKMLPPPRNLAEFIFISWPISWGYVMLAAAVAVSIPFLRLFWRPVLWPLYFGGFWLFWQFLSATRTVEHTLTQPTLLHFAACGVVFLLGWWALSRQRVNGWFWTPVLLAFLYVLFSGFDQHNGGLESTRKAFYEQPNWQQLYTREYVQKIESNRVFGTLVYPNALAELILLLLPAGLYQTWRLTGRWPRVARGVITGLFGYLGIGCLFWSGSKGGWLIALIMSAILLLHFNFSRKLKVALVTCGLLAGLVIFFVRFTGYFQKGATSVSARFTYWSAAWQTAKTHPVFGTGPGTFSKPYSTLKPKDAEMAKLAHNDYLQQASDSGWLGGASFAAFMASSLYFLYRKTRDSLSLNFLLWLGLAGWACQAFIEFGLYIPALAWPTFLFLGYLWGVEEPLVSSDLKTNVNNKV